MSESSDSSISPILPTRSTISAPKNADTGQPPIDASGADTQTSEVSQNAGNPEVAEEEATTLEDPYAAHRQDPGRSSRIWTKAETTILVANLNGYMELHTGKEKREHIRQKVAKAIKISWGDRYSDTNLEDSDRRAEWRKKKKVSRSELRKMFAS